MKHTVVVDIVKLTQTVDRPATEAFGQGEPNSESGKWVADGEDLDLPEKEAYSSFNLNATDIKLPHSRCHNDHNCEKSVSSEQG